MWVEVAETINESRATREAQAGSLFGSPGSPGQDGWNNKLVWGDNKLVMGSLLKDYAGKVNLIYIDPPFAGFDYEEGLLAVKGHLWRIYYGVVDGKQPVVRVIDRESGRSTPVKDGHPRHDPPRRQLVSFLR